MTTVHEPNFAERFIGTMVDLKAHGRFDPRRFAPCPEGTAPRLHKGRHSDWFPGRGRLLRGRFH